MAARFRRSGKDGPEPRKTDVDQLSYDSIQPKFQIALQSLNYSVMNPHAPQTENLLKETEETIAKMENIKQCPCCLFHFREW